jgi:hypothetical protein
MSFKFISKFFNKRKTTYSKAIGNKSITLPESEKIENNYPMTIGSRNIIVGVDAKVTPTGRCKRGDVTKATKEFVTGPFSAKPTDNICIFNRHGNCYFSGICKDKVCRAKVKRVIK